MDGSMERITKSHSPARHRSSGSCEQFMKTPLLLIAVLSFAAAPQMALAQSATGEPKFVPDKPPMTKQ
jgi:hypothetical protein